MMRPSIHIAKTAELRGHQGPVYTLLPGFEPRTLLSAGSEGIIAEWNLDTQEAVAITQAGDAIFAMCALPNANRLALGLQGGGIIFVEKGQSEPLAAKQLHTKAVFDFLVLPNGKQLVATDQSGWASIWDLETFEPVAFSQIAPASVRTLVLAPDGQTLLAGSSDGKIRQLTFSLKELNEWMVSELSVFRLLVIGNEIWETGRDAHLRSWNASNMERTTREIPAHMYAVNDLIAHPHQPWLLSGSMDKTIKIWNWDDGSLLKVMDTERNQVHRNGVNRLLWHENRLYSTGDDRIIMEWDIRQA